MHGTYNTTTFMTEDHRENTLLVLREGADEYRTDTAIMDTVHEPLGPYHCECTHRCGRCLEETLTF